MSALRAIIALTLTPQVACDMNFLVSPMDLAQLKQTYVKADLRQEEMCAIALNMQLILLELAILQILTAALFLQDWITAMHLIILAL